MPRTSSKQTIVLESRKIENYKSIFSILTISCSKYTMTECDNFFTVNSMVIKAYLQQLHRSVKQFTIVLIELSWKLTVYQYQISFVLLFASHVIVMHYIWHIVI